MSIYDYTREGSRLSIETSIAGDSIYISAQPLENPLFGMWIPNADIPTVALELLKANPDTRNDPQLSAAVKTLAAYVTEQKVKQQEEAKLRERRDGVAGELFDLEYKQSDSRVQKAVDLIIELRDKLEATK